MSEAGLLSLKHGEHFYTLAFPERGWLAVELLGFLEDILDAAQPAGQILKLLGYTIQISIGKPAPIAGHWVVVSLDEKLVETNSYLLRKIVDEQPLAPDDPLSAGARDRVYQVLDRNDFTVKLYR